MAIYGADIAQLNQLASQLSSKASDLQNVVKTLSSTVQSVEWKGPDADKFRSDWTGHVSQLNKIVSDLQAASQSAKKNAQQQEQASSGS